MKLVQTWGVHVCVFEVGFYLWFILIAMDRCNQSCPGGEGLYLCLCFVVGLYS